MMSIYLPEKFPQGGPMNIREQAAYRVQLLTSCETLHELYNRFFAQVYISKLPPAEKSAYRERILKEKSAIATDKLIKRKSI